MKITDLSYDEIIILTTYLDLPAILSLSLTNKSLHNVYHAKSLDENRSKNIWEVLFLNHFPPDLKCFFPFFAKIKDAYFRAWKMTRKVLKGESFEDVFELMKYAFFKAGSPYRLVLFDLYFLMDLMKINEFLKFRHNYNVNCSYFMGLCRKMIEKSGPKDELVKLVLLDRFEEAFLKESQKSLDYMLKMIKEGKKVDYQTMLYFLVNAFLRASYVEFCEKNIKGAVEILEKVRETVLGDRFGCWIFGEVCCVRLHYLYVYGCTLIDDGQKDKGMRILKDAFEGYCESKDVDDLIVRRTVKILQKMKDKLNEICREMDRVENFHLTIEEFKEIQIKSIGGKKGKGKNNKCDDDDDLI